MKAVLFDFFGTLVNYSNSRVAQGYQATHSFLGEIGLDIDYGEFLQRWVNAHEECDSEREVSGREYRMQDVSDKFLAGFGPKEWPESIASRLWNLYISEWSTGIKPIPGVSEMLKELRGRCKIGVVSNTQTEGLIHEQLDRIGVRPYVDVVVTSVEHGLPKPDPSIFHLALDLVGCTAADALFVGDSYVHDYIGATNVGMKALLISPMSESRAPLSDTIESVLEVGERLFPGVVAEKVIY